MEIKKLNIPGLVCPVCNKKLTHASQIAIIDKKIITHFLKCSIGYLIDENNKLPEDKQEKISFYDIAFRLTDNYEQSNKAISEEELKDYRTKFKYVVMLTDNIIVKKIIRDRIWDAVGRKYAEELQYLHALSKIYEEQKNKWRDKGFKSTFIPSVIEQFKARGYLSKKQWKIIEQLVEQNITDDDRQFLWKNLNDVINIDNLVLPDKLRYLQRRKSFLKWFNQKNGIPEEE